MKAQKSELAQLVHLALSGSVEDVRLFVARLVRKHRVANPDLAEEMNTCLRNFPSGGRSVMRDVSSRSASKSNQIPAADESQMPLLRMFEKSSHLEEPFLSEELSSTLKQLIQERENVSKLLALGLHPARTAIFVGPPGVGKTLSARWLASKLNLPLYVLDLTSVMSSFLGKSGSNLRSALDFAKSRPCVLLLDEIDSIAKKRSDDTDIGELKRLVTIILQELDEWPSANLLLAATNHPELIDPALWRRFDLVIEFPFPAQDRIKDALIRFLGKDFALFDSWIEILVVALQGCSFSDIERVTQRFRRALALEQNSLSGLIEAFISTRIQYMDQKQRINYALQLSRETQLSQHAISKITKVSRDTIRSHMKKGSTP